MPWKDDTELFALMRAKLFPAAVGDILDTMGLLHQFLPAAIRPMDAIFWDWMTWMLASSSSLRIFKNPRMSVNTPT